MRDRTVAARVRRQRDARVTEGWVEVKVWVPTETDANDVRKLAAERRAKALALHGLCEEIRTVTPEKAARIAKAIEDHGSAAYNTPSGAVLDLMTELANEGDLQSFARAFVILARAKPANAQFVAAAVPGKISNFLVNHGGISSNDLNNWAADNPDWSAELQRAVRNPDSFDRVVEAMADAIRKRGDKH
ncbi:MAG: hypothetical protein KDJ37_07935 [Hyphomicrobiaceae bacterium]|nr:hypothetical protein [Hyphomicrobiaceae bacterium]